MVNMAIVAGILEINPFDWPETLEWIRSYTIEAERHCEDYDIRETRRDYAIPMCTLCGGKIRVQPSKDFPPTPNNTAVVISCGHILHEGCHDKLRRKADADRVNHGANMMVCGFTDNRSPDPVQCGERMFYNCAHNRAPQKLPHLRCTSDPESWIDPERINEDELRVLDKCPPCCLQDMLDTWTESARAQNPGLGGLYVCCAGKRGLSEAEPGDKALEEVPALRGEASEKSKTVEKYFAGAFMDGWPAVDAKVSYMRVKA